MTSICNENSFLWSLFKGQVKEQGVVNTRAVWACWLKPLASCSVHHIMTKFFYHRCAAFTLNGPMFALFSAATEWIYMTSAWQVWIDGKPQRGYRFETVLKCTQWGRSSAPLSPDQAAIVQHHSHAFGRSFWLAFMYRPNPLHVHTTHKHCWWREES